MKFPVSNHSGFLTLGCLTIAVCFFIPSIIDAQTASSEEVDEILQEMDRAGKNFKSFTAELSQRKYTAILEEFDTEETGTFAYRRTRDGQTLIRKEITSPSHSIAIINRDEGLIYYPKIKQAHKIRLGEHKGKAEFLAIGVGQSGGKLKSHFDIQVQGHETVDGVPVVVLALRPKSEKTAAFLSLITLWMDEVRWIPVQTRLQEPNDDYLLTKFSKIELNAKIPLSRFSLKVPSDVEIDRQPVG